MKKVLRVLVVLAVLSVSVSCVTTNVEERKIKEIQQENRRQGRNANVNFTLPEDAENEEYRRRQEDVNVISRREEIFIPVDSQTRQPLTPNQAAARTQSAAIATPQTHVGGTQYYDYDENKQYPIVTKPLALTTIMLESGEVPIGVPYMSDTVRWEVTGDVWRTVDGKQVQLIMVKPLETGLSTNMVVVTDRRIYQILLSSTRDSYMPVVRFRYPFGMMGQFATMDTIREDARRRESGYSSGVNEDGYYLSYNYKIRASMFKPEWMPTEAWDDGHKTYIRLPRGVLQREYPVIFEDRNFIINYRVEENVIILDKLIKKVTLRLNRKRVVVEKMKGQPVDVRRYVRSEVEVIGDAPPLNNGVRFDISGQVDWMPIRVMEYDRETHIFFEENVFDLNAVIQIIDENRNSVEYRRVGNVITIPRVIRRIQIAYKNQILTITRRS